MDYHKWRREHYTYCFGVWYELVTPGKDGITNGKFHKEEIIIKKFLKESYGQRE